MKSDEELTDAIVRMTRALGRRCAETDPDSVRLLLMVQDELRESMALAVEGWRSTGATDGQIGREMGITRQAVQKRWPREGMSA